MNDLRAGRTVLLDGKHLASITELHFDESIGLCEATVRRMFPGMDSPLLSEKPDLETVALHRISNAEIECRECGGFPGDGSTFVSCETLCDKCWGRP